LKRDDFEIARDRKWACAEMVRVTSDMLEGRLSFLEGAVRITQLRHNACLDDDEDASIFVAIESETDHLPLGEVQKLWDQDALEKLQPTIESWEKYARDEGLEACKRLAKKCALPPGPE
jgi:hypothetical protein